MLRCSGMFPCTSAQCAGTVLVHVPRNTRQPNHTLPQPAHAASATCGEGHSAASSSSSGGAAAGGGAGGEAVTLQQPVVAAGKCGGCGVYVCRACTWRACHVVPFHAPLPCSRRVAVVSCVARIESALQELDRKHTPAAASAGICLLVCVDKQTCFFYKHRTSQGRS